MPNCAGACHPGFFTVPEKDLPRDWIGQGLVQLDSRVIPGKDRKDPRLRQKRPEKYARHTGVDNPVSIR